MNEKELAEWLKYSSPKEIYIVTWDNTLKRLCCPFKVVVLRDIGVLKLGEIVRVDLVKVTPRLITVFVIYERAYYYYHFDFVLE